MAKTTPGVLASFEHIDAACDAIKALRAEGRKDLTVYYSHPNHELEEACGHHSSPVRLFTLIGGLTGLTAAFAMQIWMNRDWPLLVGGKPIVAIPAFVVVGFELTVLLGALSTLFGVFLLSAALRNKGVIYDGRFSDDRIGVFVPAGAAQSSDLERRLRDAGAVEVTHATA
ncbi:MAG: DUF3341 domain-containing protein [Gemmatimonadales bacterium]|jgi:hypothetical protein|nr:DUF3341 domain-containing protein [Gemmatimonadales bacterium]